MDVHDTTDGASGSSRAYSVTKILAALCPGSLFEARLTLSSATPVTGSDVASSTSLYLTPYKGARVSLYDGTQWVPYLLSEIVATVSGFATVQTTFTGTTTSASAVVTAIASTAALYIGQPITGSGVPAGTTILSVDSGTQITLSANATASASPSLSAYAANYDVFLYVTGGTLTLSFVAWTNNNTRASALSTRDGVRVLGSDATKKLVGTVRLSSNTTIDDTLLRRFVLNEYNQVPRRLFASPAYSNNNSASSYTTASTTFTPANGAVGWRVEFLCDGQQLAQFHLNSFSSATNGSQCQAGIAIDSKASALVFVQSYAPVAGVAWVQSAKWQDTLSAGYHYAGILISASGGVTATFYADFSRQGSAADPYATYMECTIIM